MSKLARALARLVLAASVAALIVVSSSPGQRGATLIAFEKTVGSSGRRTARRSRSTAGVREKEGIGAQTSASS